mgnify:CR=1 FL=1|jgi:hypothetical protein
MIFFILWRKKELNDFFEAIESTIKTEVRKEVKKQLKKEGSP